MKYTLKEMCNNALRQDLATHKFDNMWNHYYLIAYACKELLDKMAASLSIADYAALNALLRDWDALTINDQYGIFEECKDGNWHTTLLKMARKYASDNGDKFLEHCKSVYLDSVRILSANMVREIHNDPSLIVLQFDKSVKTIPDNCYSSNKNLSTVIIPETVYRVGKNAFADCDNLTTVYIDGTPTVEKSAFPSNAVIRYIGSGDTSEIDKFKKELNTLTDEKKAVESKVQVLSEENAKLADEKNELLKTIEELKEANTESSDNQSQIDELTKAIEQERNAHSELKGKHDDLYAKYVELQKAHSDLIFEYEHEKQEYHNEIEQLTIDMQKKAAEVAPKEDHISDIVAKLITEMLPNGQAAITKAREDEHFATVTLPTMYEKCCILRYKYGVQALARMESLDAKISMLSKGTENDYTKAMNTLRTMFENGRLSSRHLDAIRDLIGVTDSTPNYRDKIVSTLEEHGYSESDYDTMYDACLKSINKTEVKYTSPADMDKLIASRMEEYLSKSSSLENAIRKHKGLAPDADVSSYIESLKMMKDIMSSSVEGMSEEAALMSLVPRLP